MQYASCSRTCALSPMDVVLCVVVGVYCFAIVVLTRFDSSLVFLEFVLCPSKRCSVQTLTLHHLLHFLPQDCSWHGEDRIVGFKWYICMSFQYFLQGSYIGEMNDLWFAVRVTGVGSIWDGVHDLDDLLTMKLPWGVGALTLCDCEWGIWQCLFWSWDGE